MDYADHTTEDFKSGTRVRESLHTGVRTRWACINRHGIKYIRNTIEIHLGLGIYPSPKVEPGAEYLYTGVRTYTHLRRANIIRHGVKIH